MHDAISITLGSQNSAAVFLMSLQPDDLSKVFSLFSVDEQKNLLKTMAALGFVDAQDVKRVQNHFLSDYDHGGGVVGTLAQAQRFLDHTNLAENEVSSLLHALHEGNVDVWKKIESLPPHVVCPLISKEHPQTIALILGKLDAQYAANLFQCFDVAMATDVMERMLHGGPVRKDILDSIKSHLETMISSADNQVDSSYQKVAHILEGIGRGEQEKLLGAFQDSHPNSARKVKKLLFTFEDFLRFRGSSAVTLIIRESDKTILAKALKGASRPLQTMIFESMSERAQALLKEEISLLEGLHIREIEEAQDQMIRLVKDLESQSRLVIPPGETP